MSTGIAATITEPLSDTSSGGVTPPPPPPTGSGGIASTITEPLSDFGPVVVIPGGTVGNPFVQINWDQPLTSHQYETGLDRGVLYPKTGPAVPWHGLVSVDENGADSSTAYYQDGRPYLIRPNPKEFSATLQAYTYPIEFAAMMGLVEATDGLYLDSQVADVFDLSYRTLVADGVLGEKAGYKIHLIYNATVAAPSSSYQTLSDSVNPTEFTWDIQAVPEPIIGYRPTAHIIVDTRHLDPSRLLVIEALLYGTASSDAHMPRPATVLDILGFGTEVTITDNGDGTWTATGSYENVYELANGTGTFVIKNANAVDHGDGTYTISSSS